jgi:hypothetical protein
MPTANSRRQQPRHTARAGRNPVSTAVAEDTCCVRSGVRFVLRPGGCFCAGALDATALEWPLGHVACNQIRRPPGGHCTVDTAHVSLNNRIKKMWSQTVRVHPVTRVHVKSIQIVFFSVLQIDLDDSMVKKAHADRTRDYELPSELPSILRFSVETSYAKLRERSKFIDRGRTAGTAALCDASKGQLDRLGEVERKDRGT